MPLARDRLRQVDRLVLETQVDKRCSLILHPYAYPDRIMNTDAVAAERTLGAQRHSGW